MTASELIELLRHLPPDAALRGTCFVYDDRDDGTWALEVIDPEHGGSAPVIRSRLRSPSRRSA